MRERRKVRSMERVRVYECVCVSVVCVCVCVCERERERGRERVCCVRVCVNDYAMQCCGCHK